MTVFRVNCQPRTDLSNTDSPSPASGTSSIGSVDSPLSSCIATHSSTPGLKPSFSANPSHRSLPFSSSGLTPLIPRTVC